MNILFVCKYNRFRSQLAEGFFKKYNRNKKLNFSSAGIFKGNPVAQNVKKIAKEFKISVGKPKSIDEKLLDRLDWVVIVANNVPKSFFNKKSLKKVLVWKIQDAHQNDFPEIKRIAGQIEKKVLGLVKSLEISN